MQEMQQRPDGCFVVWVCYHVLSTISIDMSIESKSIYLKLRFSYAIPDVNLKKFVLTDAGASKRYCQDATNRWFWCGWVGTIWYYPQAFETKIGLEIQGEDAKNWGKQKPGFKSINLG